MVQDVEAYIITECVGDLAKRSEIIIFKSLLTTFEASSNF